MAVQCESMVIGAKNDEKFSMFVEYIQGWEIYCNCNFVIDNKEAFLLNLANFVFHQLNFFQNGLLNHESMHTLRLFDYKDRKIL